jgi:hypothetical protein
MTLIGVVLWAGLLGGLVTAAWFLLTFRPAWPPRSPAFVVWGLVGVIGVLYGRHALLLAVRGWMPQYEGAGDAVISLTLLALADAALIALLVKFQQFRTAWRAELRRRKEEDQ